MRAGEREREREREREAKRERERKRERKREKERERERGRERESARESKPRQRKSISSGSDGQVKEIKTIQVFREISLKLQKKGGRQGEEFL